MRYAASGTDGLLPPTPVRSLVEFFLYRNSGTESTRCGRFIIEAKPSCLSIRRYIAKRSRLAKASKSPCEDVLAKRSRIAKRGLEIGISIHDEIYSFIYPLRDIPIRRSRSNMCSLILPANPGKRSRLTKAMKNPVKMFLQRDQGL